MHCSPFLHVNGAYSVLQLCAYSRFLATSFDLLTATIGKWARYCGRAWDVRMRPTATVANPHIVRSLGSKETHIRSHNHCGHRIFTLKMPNTKPLAIWVGSSVRFCGVFLCDKWVMCCSWNKKLIVYIVLGLPLRNYNNIQESRAIARKRARCRGCSFRFKVHRQYLLDV